MKVPGFGPGPSSVSGPAEPEAARERPWLRPGLGLGVALGFYVAAVVVSLVWPPVFPGRGAWPLWAQALIDVIGLLAVLAAGAVVVARVAGHGLRRALGIRFSASDVALGLFVALLARAVVELVTPTTGSLVPVFAETGADRVATAAVVTVGAVLLAPVAEELFFRGAVQRLIHQLGRPALGNVAAGITAIGVTTMLFVLLHAVPYGTAVPVAMLLPPLLIGVGAGALVAATGRLGGALIAHILFNAAGVVLALV